MDELTREIMPDVDVEATSLVYSDLIEVRVPDSPAMLFPDIVDLVPEVIKTAPEPVVDSVDVIDDVDMTADIDAVTYAAPDVKVDEEVSDIDLGIKVGQVMVPAVSVPVERDYVAGAITGLKYGIGGMVATTVGYGVYSVVDSIASLVTSTPSLIAGAFVTAASAVTFAGIKYRAYRQTRALADEGTMTSVGRVKLGDATARQQVQRRASGRPPVVPISPVGGQSDAEMVTVQRSVGASATSPVTLVSVNAMGDDATHHHVGRQTSALNVGVAKVRSATQPSGVQRVDAPPVWWSKSVDTRPLRQGRLSEWMNGEPIVIGSQSESKATDVKAASLAYWGDDTIEDDSLLFDSLTRMWIMLMRDPSTEQVVGSWIGKEKFKPCEVFGSTNKLDQGARCAVGHLLQIVDPDGWNPRGGPVHNDLGAVCNKYGHGFIWDVIKRNDSGRYTLPEVADYVRDELAKRV